MEIPIVSYKSECKCCKQEVEFLSVYPSDFLCSTCQYNIDQTRYDEYYGDKHSPEWTLYWECRIILERQALEREKNGHEAISLKAIRLQKRRRAMQAGRR